MKMDGKENNWHRKVVPWSQVGGTKFPEEGSETWTINLGDVSDQKKPSQTGALDRVPSANMKKT